jgi:hypothetical protein
MHARLLCTVCGKPIGVYEPFVRINDDGTRTETSILQLDRQGAPLAAVRAAHVDCLRPASSSE